MSEERPEDRKTDAIPRPAWEKIGPYRILDTLGRGGMGVVYRAEHESTGELVALKTVRVQNERLIGSIRREIHALLRVRHPGIVKVIAEGIEKGVPWYAMELCRGLTVKPYLSRATMGRGPASQNEATETANRESWWTACLGSSGRDESVAGASALGKGMPASHAVDPAHLAAIVELMARVCAPLGYLHGEGIVHRDLKPDNILVLEDRKPILVDFGLMARSGGDTSRDALEVSGETAGTIAYMAPEQIRGEIVDARADLYALGCILYDLLTGRPPFTGETAANVLGQHLQAVPRPLSELVSGIPEPLEALVMRLLAKRPRDRVGYADDVAATLERLGLCDLGRARSRARSYLYRPGLAGRGEPLRELHEHLQSLRKGTGGVMLISGESGVGKTRLATELAREAMKMGAWVLTGECGSRAGGGGRGSAPLQGFRGVLQAIADRCRDRGPAETGRVLGRRGKALAPYEPALAGLPGQESEPDPPDIGPSESELRLFSYFSEVLRILAERDRLVVIVDDLQWADDLSLGFIEHVVRAGQLSPMPLLVVGTYRTEEMGERLSRIAHSAGVGRIALERLDGSAVAEMVADMLALPSPPSSFVRFLSQQSEGNPFFVSEYLRTAVWEEILTRDDDGRWRIHETEGAGAGSAERVFDAFPLPSSIRELVARRLDGLLPLERKVVEVASVIGRELSLARLTEVSGLAEGDVFEAVRGLVTRYVLEEVDEARYGFVHEKLREAAYEGVSGYRRRRLHQAVAEAIERDQERDPASAEMAILASHWEHAGRLERARPCLLTAARQARQKYSQEEAERLYRSYLALANDLTQESVEARLDLALVIAIRGRSYEAIREVRQAIEEAQELGEGKLEARALREIASLYHATGRIDEALAFFQKALDMDRAQGNARGEAAVLDGLGSLHQDLGRLEDARRCCEQALSLAQGVGDRARVGTVWNNLANALLRQGAIEDARRAYEEALRVAEALSDRRLETQAIANLATLHHGQGRMDEAIRCYERSLALAKDLGLRRSEGITLANLGICKHLAGAAAEARGLYDEALRIACEVGDLASEGSTLFYLATLDLDLGQVAEARSRCERALQIHRDIRDRRYEAICLCLLGGILRLDPAEMEGSRKVLHEAAAMLRSVGDKMELAKCLCEQGYVELCEGRDAEGLLGEAAQLARDLGVGSGSELGVMIEKLERAVCAHRAGEPLLRGMVPHDIPTAVRRGLLEPPP